MGSMKGLQDISGLLEAPALRELTFVRKMGVTQEEAAAIAAHGSIKRFSWFAGVVRVDKPRREDKRRMTPERNYGHRARVVPARC